MADPLTPRLPGQPPPLPDRFRPLVDNTAVGGIAPEPFPPDEKAPDTLRLGAPAPRATMLPPPDPLTETTAALLRQELALHREVMRETLPTQPALPIPPAPGLPSLEPASLRTRSKAVVAGLLAGKYGLVVLLGGVVLRAVAKKWPQFGDLIEGILQGVGL